VGGQNNQVVRGSSLLIGLINARESCQAVFAKRPRV